MPLAIDHEELEPVPFYRPDDETSRYRIREGQIIFRNTPIRGAHAPTFRFYRNGFAKDRKNCYWAGRRLTGARPETFRTLNYTYATDGVGVWALWSRIKTADAASFEVCDDGFRPLTKEMRKAIGFGKDAERVYFFDSDGQANLVRKANPTTFVSMNQGYYGKDDSFVFCGFATIPRARVASWQMIGGEYSKDDRHVFYHNRMVPEADRETFQIVAIGAFAQLAKDKDRLFDCGRVVEQASFDKTMRNLEEYIRKMGDEHQ